jgi:5-methylcytosine-specific restriction endonuclease McrA
VKRSRLRPRPRLPLTLVEREAAAEFRRQGLRQCERAGSRYVCPCCGVPRLAGEIEIHHVVAKSKIKSYVSGLRLPADEAAELLVELLWSPRNALALCERVHARHTSARERVPRSMLSEANWAFAEELDLAWLLEREYRVTDQVREKTAGVRKPP